MRPPRLLREKEKPVLVRALANIPGLRPGQIGEADESYVAAGLAEPVDTVAPVVTVYEPAPKTKGKVAVEVVDEKLETTVAEGDGEVR